MEAGTPSVSTASGPPPNHRPGSGRSRYSILSDPRLSQLFALSSQLEALAESCCQEEAAVGGGVSPQPPPIPPKNGQQLMTGLVTLTQLDTNIDWPVSSWTRVMY